MLTVVRSPEPTVSLDPARWPGEGAELLQRLVDRPSRCQWIVPTKRRRRALQHESIRRAERSACLLPGLHTLETFVCQTLEYSPRQRRLVGGPERLLRLARIWQELRGHPAGPGLVNHLSRFVRDWQACKLPVPARPRDVFEAVVQRYVNGLEQDQRLDRMSSLAALTAEVRDADSWPNRLFLRNVDLILFDGFHRLEIAELELIAALSHRCDVLLWMVGSPGSRGWKTLEEASKILKKQGKDVRLLDHVPPPASLVAALGRSLFADVTTKFDKVSGVVELTAETARAEVEAVARRIKADYRAARGVAIADTTAQLRLSDIAVVIPGPAYDPLVREVFPRAGLEFNLAGRALLVSTSRPARVLDAALQLIRSQWRHERLRDFLNLPMVRRRLVDAHRLALLFEHRPRARRRLDQRAWLDFWKQHLDRLGERIDAWRRGQPVPDGTILTREQLIERQSELHASSSRLLTSIATVLQPLGDLEAALDSDAASGPPMKPLVDGCVRLLETLEIATWLTPPAEEAPLPWVEYEKDQQAYYKLLAILKALRDMPAKHLPRGHHDRPDALAVLDLALSGETYQIRTEDDAGVQLFELREIRGLRFRHVYALGLIDGQVPSVPEEGMLARRRRQMPALDKQLDQKEAEADHLFAQLFEAAGERLVLSRPIREPDQQTLPSRYLTAVAERVELPLLEAPRLIADARTLAVQSARASVRANPTEAEKFLRSRLQDWLARPDWPQRVRIDSPFLMALLYPERRPFSPSELETYAACPLRYFGTHLLRLAEREPDQARMHYGALVHRVLQTFYVELREACAGAADTPLQSVNASQRTRLLELFDQEWERLDDASLSPDLRRLFAHPQGVAQLFFDVMGLMEAEHGNLLNEFVLQDDQRNAVFLGNDAQQRPVHVTGKIDRVDVRRDEPTKAVVLDYKTGKATGPKRLRTLMEDGRLLQLPLYAALLTRLRPALEVVGGAYVHLSECAVDARRAVAFAGKLLPRKDKRWDVPFEVERAVLKTLELVGRMRAGDFSLTDHPAGTPHAECTAYCPLRHACRQR